MSTAEAVFLAIVGPLLAYCVYADFRDGRIAKLRMRARRRRIVALGDAPAETTVKGFPLDKARELLSDVLLHRAMRDEPAMNASLDELEELLLPEHARERRAAERSAQPGPAAEQCEYEPEGQGRCVLPAGHAGHHRKRA